MGTRPGIVIALLSLVLLPLAACSRSTGTTLSEKPRGGLTPAGYVYIDYSGNSPGPADPWQLKLEKAVWGPLSIYLLGSTSLSDGVKRITTTLYKDGEPVEWWPATQFLRPNDGRWEIQVKANEDGSPAEFPGFENGYSLHIAETGTMLAFDSPAAHVETPVPASDKGPPVELEGTRWILVSIGGGSPLSGTEITMEFHQGQAIGFADCNTYGGRYVIKAPDLIEIYDISVTTASCGEDSNRQSGAFLNYLGRAVVYRIEDDELEMYDVISNQKTLVFKQKP